MSFGYAIGDFVVLTQLAWDVVQNSRKACGAHDELTSEATSLHIVLRRLEIEVSKPNSILARSDDGTDRKEELAQLSEDCRRVLRTLDKILKKYNALSEEKRSVTKLWKKVQFGNGEMLDLAELRIKIATSTSALTLFLNLLSIGSQGKVESYMESQGGALKEMRRSLNWITASMQAKAPRAGEGSILTTYAGDDKAIWKDFRRELIREGFSSELLERHMETIKGYVMELGSRGALDDFKDDFDVEEAFLEDMTGIEVSENMNVQEHSEHESQKRSKFDTLDCAKWSEEHSVELAANTPEERLHNDRERKSGMECEERSEQILERKLGDDKKKETAELVMQTHTEPQDSGETLESTGNEALQFPRQGFEYLSNFTASTLDDDDDDDSKPVSSEFTTAVANNSHIDSYSSKPVSRGRENISMNNLDGTAVDIKSIARQSQTLATDPITPHKLLEFDYDPELYIRGTSESLIGTNQLFFGPHRQHSNQVRPWISMQITMSPIFRHRTLTFDDSPSTYRPHSLCHLILCLSRWYAQSQTSVICSTYPPNILSSVVDEFQRLFSRAIAYHSRMITSQVGGAYRRQFLLLFRTLLLRFFHWVKLGVRHMLWYDKGDESFNSSAWWMLDEDAYYWHRKEGDLVSVPIPDARQHARPLNKLGTRAYRYFLHGLFEDEKLARSGRATFADLMIKLQSLLLYFKRWCEEDLLDDENTRISKLSSPDMSDAAVANAVYELKMCKLALETWSFQNDYSDSVKEQRFPRGENSLSAILQRSDESQQKLWCAQIYHEYNDKKSPDPRSGKKNSKKK